MRFLGGWVVDFSEAVKQNADLIQFVAIVVGFIACEPLLAGIGRFFRDKWRY
jgi:hypothetical protein